MSVSSHTSDTKPIALLVTVYNRPQKLARMLASIEDKIALLDIVLVDDGSKPPIDIAAYSGYPIHLIRLDKNIGAMAAANIGLQYILERPYEYIARLDSDDISLPGRFSKQLAFMREHTDVVILGTAFEIMDETGKIIGSSLRVFDDKQIRKFMHTDCMLHHTTWMLRASAVRECGFYKSHCKVTGDYDYAWRMMRCGKAANLPDKLVRYETGASDSLSAHKRRLQAWNALKVKLLNFDVFELFSYLGIIYSVLDLLRLRVLINYMKPHFFKR